MRSWCARLFLSAANFTCWQPQLLPDSSRRCTPNRCLTTRQVRTILDDAKGPNVKIIAQVDCADAIKNFDEILDACDGVMVSRINLGMDVPASKVGFTRLMDGPKLEILGVWMGWCFYSGDPGITCCLLCKWHAWSCVIVLVCIVWSW